MTPDAPAVELVTSQLHGTPFAPVPLDGAVWSGLLDDVRRHKLVGWLLSAVVDERLATTDAQREEARQLHLRTATSALLLERRLLDVLSLLGKHGIDAMLLKGPAVAHLDYPDPALRLYHDIDILLRSADVDRAFRVLLANGYRRPFRQPRPGFDRRFGKGATLHDAAGWELDVHRTFVFGAFGLSIELDSLFDEPAVVTIGGRAVPALNRTHRYLHACYHAALGGREPLLAELVDVVLMHRSSDLDQAAVVEEARRWRGLAVMGRAHRLVSDVLGVRLSGPAVEAGQRHRIRPEEQRALDSYVGPGHSLASQIRAALPFLPGLPARFAFVRAFVQPTAGFLDDRNPGYLRWLRRGFRSLRQSREAFDG